MPTFSKASRFKLFGCVKELQELFNEVIKEYDCTILCGHRNEIDQEAAFNAGNSKLHYPYSKHNSDPSKAVDVAPYHADVPHIRWDDIEDFKKFATHVKACANKMDIKIIWGGDFPELYHTKFVDYPHFEIKE